MTAAVHQFLPSLAAWDAIGAHTLSLQQLLRDMGFDSEIFADEVKPEMTGRARPYRSFSSRRWRWARDPTWLVYQSSIGSPVADFVVRRDEPKLVYFHNITPRRLVEGWDPGVGQASATGWAQLARLAPKASAGVAASCFNQRLLVRAGCTRSWVVPPLVDRSAFEADADVGALRRLATEKTGTDMLFVGRISPHKGQHHLVAALAAYRRAYDPGARLHLVGGCASESYLRGLVAYVAELGLAGAVDLAGAVTPGQLSAYYHSADVFVCASAHEGFCVPLLEAMDHDLPVVAYRAAAVPETLGGGGVLVASRAPTAMAAAIGRVVGDPVLRLALARAARLRLDQLSPARSRLAMAGAIEAAIGQSPSGSGAVRPPTSATIVDTVPTRGGGS